MNIEELKLKDLQPSQFYISEKKLHDIEVWLDPADLSGFEPIPVKILDGIPVMTDGIRGLLQRLEPALRRYLFLQMKMSWTGKCIEDAFRNAGSETSLAPQICLGESSRKANMMRNGTSGVIACRRKL